MHVAYAVFLFVWDKDMLDWAGSYIDQKPKGERCIGKVQRNLNSILIFRLFDQPNTFLITFALVLIRFSISHGRIDFAELVDRGVRILKLLKKESDLNFDGVM